MEKKWRCTVCGYIHVGDEPPEICPVCGVDASFFELLPPDDTENAEKADKAGKADKADQTEKADQADKVVKLEKIPDVAPEEAVKQALFRFSYGLFIITSCADGKDNGQCANTCFQITSEPARIAIGINKNNYTHELIEQSGKIGVSILNQTGQDYAKRFGYRSGRDLDKFEGLAVHRGSSGVLLLDDVLATLEATVTSQLDAGTHTLYLAEVTSAEVLQQGDPMTYAYFRATK